MRITVVVICDTCAKEYQIGPESRRGRAHRHAQKTVEEALKDGWMEVSRGRYHAPAHYCPACKDLPAKPIKDTRKRHPKRKLPPCTIIGAEPDPTLEADWWKDGEKKK